MSLTTTTSTNFNEKLRLLCDFIDPDMYIPYRTCPTEDESDVIDYYLKNFAQEKDFEPTNNNTTVTGDDSVEVIVDVKNDRVVNKLKTLCDHIDYHDKEYKEFYFTYVTCSIRYICKKLVDHYLSKYWKMNNRYCPASMQGYKDVAKKYPRARQCTPKYTEPSKIVTNNKNNANVNETIFKNNYQHPNESPYKQTMDKVFQELGKNNANNNIKFNVPNAEQLKPLLSNLMTTLVGPALVNEFNNIQ